MFEKIESCIKDLKENKALLELEGFVAQIRAENEKLKVEREKYRADAANQMQENEKLLNIFLEHVRQRENVSAYQQEAEDLRNENENLKIMLENAKSWTEAKERYESEYKKLLGIGEILGSANNDVSQRAIEKQNGLDEILAEKQKVEKELFQLKKQRDEAEEEYNNKRKLIDDLMAGVRDLGIAEN